MKAAQRSPRSRRVGASARLSLRQARPMAPWRTGRSPARGGGGAAGGGAGRGRGARPGPGPGGAEGPVAHRLLYVAVGEVGQEDGDGEPEGEELRAVERHVEAGTGDHEHRPVPEGDAVGAG